MAQCLYPFPEPLGRQPESPPNAVVLPDGRFEKFLHRGAIKDVLPDVFTEPRLGVRLGVNDQLM